jgi:hypothetical protein
MLCGTKAATWYLGMGRRPQTAHRCTSCLKDSIILWRTKQSISLHDWAWLSRQDLRNGKRVGKANPPTTWSHPGSSESVTKGGNPAQNTLLYGIQTWQTTKRLNDYTVNVWSAKLRHCLYRRFGIALYLENSDLATSVAGWYSWQLSPVSTLSTCHELYDLATGTTKIAVLLRYSC